LIAKKKIIGFWMSLNMMKPITLRPVMTITITPVGQSSLKERFQSLFTAFCVLEGEAPEYELSYGTGDKEEAGLMKGE
jgi:hypothetical protein